MPIPAGCQVSEVAEDLSSPGACVVPPAAQGKQQDFLGAGRALNAFSLESRLPPQKRCPYSIVRAGLDRDSPSVTPSCPQAVHVDPQQDTCHDHMGDDSYMQGEQSGGILPNRLLPYADGVTCVKHWSAPGQRGHWAGSPGGPGAVGG